MCLRIYMQIIRAWRANKMSNALEPVSADKVTCHIIGSLE